MSATTNGTGRTANGRFAAGNPGGPGRPPRPTEMKYLATLADSVTLADWRQIVARAVADAKAGDSTARAWLAQYVIGKEPPRLAAVTAYELAAGAYDELASAMADLFAKHFRDIVFDRHDHRGKAENLLEVLYENPSPQDVEDMGLTELPRVPWDEQTADLPAPSRSGLD